MRLALFGPGRIGAALFPLLARNGHDVVLLTRAAYGDFLSPSFAPEMAVQDLQCDATLILPGRFELNAVPSRMLQANATGPIRLAEALHAHLPHAHIIAFLDARVDWPEAALPPAVRAYVASKRALADWVRHAALTWGRATGTRVNAIAPGPVLPPPDKAHREKAGECLTPRPTLNDLYAAIDFLLRTPSVTGQTLYVAAGQQILGGMGKSSDGAMDAETQPMIQDDNVLTPRYHKQINTGDIQRQNVAPLLGKADPKTVDSLQPSIPQHVTVALTIAGSDSGGGAGIQADLRAFRDFGVHGCSAITALTAQNPHGVSGVMAASPEILRGQLERVVEDFAVGAVKTGMLMDATRIAVVADFLSRLHCPWVVDPVMVATSGARLLDAAAIATLREQLLPYATLVTPNLPEAQALLGDSAPAATLEAQIDAARRLYVDLGAAVLVKGGHAKDRPATDILCCAEGIWRFDAPTCAPPLTTHGTGCALSSAIAAGLALGHNLREAITAAKDYVFGLLCATEPAGRAAIYAPNVLVSQRYTQMTRL